MTMAFIGIAAWRAAHALQESATQTANSSSLPFRLVPVRLTPNRFEHFATPADYQSAAVFGESLFVCGRSALFQFDGAGHQKAVWHAGQELPPAPLTTLTVRRGIGVPELWIGTSGGGILIYDGQLIRQLLPAAQAMRKITALLPLADGRVLIGTAEAGLFVTDGKRLERFHLQFDKTQITALAGDEDSVWIGTRNDGVLLWHGGQMSRFREELPDPQVLSITTAANGAWVGTPVGVAEFSGSHFRRRLADGFFAQTLGVWNDTLFVGTVDEGAVAVPLTSPKPHASLQSSGSSASAVPVVSFVRLSDRLLAISPNTLTALPSGEEIIHQNGNTLAATHIAALHADTLGRLWIGYFDRGVDILPLRDMTGKRHLEDDQLFCVNRIKESASHHTMAVATANGLGLFDGAGRLRQMLDRQSGLIASHVTDILFEKNDENLVVATPAGLSFVQDGRVSSVYAFQGLVNNHVYTLSDYRGSDRSGRLFAGTLGGFSLLKDQLVEASYTTANSSLRQNWITASVEAWGNLYFGTYGSGVIRLNAQGETGAALVSFREFAAREGRVEINPNAMLATDNALYAGTADRGLAILRQGSERWTFVTSGLPSLNVTALAERNGSLYAGTDNGLVRIAEHDLP
jgi:ligand-binding sensor domain-containing protein